MDPDSKVLKAYLKSFCRCESVNVNKKGLSLVELVTCPFCKMSEIKAFFLQDGFPKLKSLEVFLDKFNRLMHILIFYIF